MAVPITPSVHVAPVSSAPPSPAPKQSVAAAAPAVPTADTVTLSLTAQVHQLRSQGQSAQQISSTLGLSTTIVSQYLGAQLPKVVVKTETAPTPAVAVAAAPEAAPTTPVPASQLPPS